MNKRIEALEKRVAELEEQTQIQPKEFKIDVKINPDTLMDKLFRVLEEHGVRLG